MTTLKEIKKQRGLTNTAIGHAIGVSASVAGMVLQGRHISVYHDEQIQKLANVLGITFERCWFAMCESYNQFMGTPGREHQRADELRFEVQTELKELTGLNVPVEEPRQLAMVEGVVVVPEERRLAPGTDLIDYKHS